MNATDYLALIISICTIIGALAASVRWMVKSYLAELKPNGGNSMRDSVNTNSERLERLETRVDEIYSLLISRRKP